MLNFSFKKNNEEMWSGRSGEQHKRPQSLKLCLDQGKLPGQAIIE